MADFSSGLNQELKDMMVNMEAHAREADSYFEGFKSQVEHMRTKVQASFETVSTDIKVNPFFSQLVANEQRLT
jgi:hypothetical protein